MIFCLSAAVITSSSGAQSNSSSLPSQNVQCTLCMCCPTLPPEKVCGRRGQPGHPLRCPPTYPAQFPGRERIGKSRSCDQPYGNKQARTAQPDIRLLLRSKLLPEASPLCER